MPRFDTPLTTNDQSFDRVLNTGLPVALIVWDGTPLDASLDETMRQVAKEDAGRVLIARLNSRENPHTTAHYHTNGTQPLVITFRDGQEITRADSADSRTLRDHVAHLLGRGPRPASGPTPPSRPQTQQNAASQPVTVSDATFQREVLSSDLPVLVDLWAPWCGPCHMIAPMVDNIARDYAGRLKVAKLNVDENPRTANTYHVQGIPTLLIFRGGRIIDRIVGAAPEVLLRGKVDAALRK